MIHQTIGFLGAGNMAEALIRGLLQTQICSRENIAAADINEIRLAHLAKNYGVQTVTGNPALLTFAPIIVLAVKPQQIPEVMHEIGPLLKPERHVLISIAAGITTELLEKKITTPVKVIRVMPNVAARLQASATAFCLGEHAGETEALLVHRIFEAVGTAVRVEESMMDAVTAISGSGPAYIFKICELMIAAGQELGLSEKDACSLSMQTIFGAARMLLEEGKKPEELRSSVTSAGGTTEAAMQSMQAAGFDEIFKSALRAARDRGHWLAQRGMGKKKL